MIVIRPFRVGDERELFEVYHSAVHRIACRDYTPEQLRAWAPRDLDPALWERKMREIRPFVAEQHGRIVGYADVQPSGYIDHFFVSGDHARQGIGSLLMSRLVTEAGARGVAELFSHVSRTAQPLYEKFGFTVVEQRREAVRGIVVPNALMRRRASRREAGADGDS